MRRPSSFETIFGVFNIKQTSKYVKNNGRRVPHCPGERCAHGKWEARIHSDVALELEVSACIPGIGRKMK